MTIFHARLETRNFTFDAYGASRAEALDAMHRGWNVHRREYAKAIRDIGAAPIMTWREVVESVQVFGVTLGTCMRDADTALVGEVL